MEILNVVVGWLWGAPAIILLFSVGLLYAVKTRFLQFRKLGYILKKTGGAIFQKSSGHGTLSPFQAAATAISGSVGTGNMAGVAAAIVSGGPGAVFWMWIIALLGMLTKLVECTLAVFFREKDDKGNFYGGPMFYMVKGISPKWKPIAVFFAITIITGGLGTAAFLQPYTIAESLKNMFGIPAWISVTVAAVGTGMVILGGFKSIGRFCEKMGTFMCVIYIAAGLTCLALNFRNIPAAFGLIFNHAFSSFQPVAGGAFGIAVTKAMKFGAARGTFSNEAGAGSSPMVHSTATTDHPFKQGMWGAFEVFVDTICVCSMTALVILTSGIDIWGSGLTGINLTMAAFESALGTNGIYLVGLSLCLFAFSSMCGWEFEYETSIVYLFGNKHIKLWRLLWLVPSFLALLQTHESVWAVVDLCSGLWVLPNVTALLCLSGAFMVIYKDYEDKYFNKTKPLGGKIEYNGNYFDCSAELTNQQALDEIKK
ncbi:alanine/glycine:cation symporter family protein [Fusobacterium ulcerans]|mgnify:CR=1 FL=1|uniref:alanine/glycine:cation symporter family protein n=1 Tax=Fusobacterium ulcerans TaxID=861 RepID=UPI0010300D7E|nr:sodium:alanine symporter family protein [Fusobacterium ulcerans]